MDQTRSGNQKKVATAPVCTSLHVCKQVHGVQVHPSTPNPDHLTPHRRVIPMNTQPSISTADYQAKQRHRARSDCADMTRRAAAAALAACAGEPDAHLRGMLTDAHRRLSSVLRELQALA